MGPARGLLLLAVCMTCGSRTCPGNCKNIGGFLSCYSTTRACYRGCKDGYFGAMCNSPCDDNCQQHQCQQKDGFCKCSQGYTFKDGSCQTHSGVDCTSNDHCFNNVCQSDSTDYCIEGCTPGWFGNFCQHRCPSHCFCEQESGNCASCIEGWYGPECGSRCSCKDKSCLRNGTCVDGCSTGSYGERCELKCSQHCVSGCDQLTGDCVQCVAGRYGSTCQSECSVGCAGTNEECDRSGKCFRGCSIGYYGKNCTFNCPQKCDSSRCDRNGTCSNCVKGFYGTSCMRVCTRCTDGICHQMTGECTKGCLSGFYGSFCNLSCEDCKDNHCDKTAEECIVVSGTWLPYIIGGGVLLIAVVLAVFIACFLKRKCRFIYITVERRCPPQGCQDSRNAVDEVTTTPTVCPISTVRQPSYIHPILSNLQIQPERPDSYCLPHYIELNENLMATPPEPPQETVARAAVISNSSFSTVAAVHVQLGSSNDENETGGEINIPLIAECFGNTETKGSTHNAELPPEAANYDHLF